MKPRLNKSITLIELLIAIVLMGVVVIGFVSIDLFSRHHIITSERRAKLQNEVSYTLEHMSKEIGKAIGDVNQVPVTIVSIAGDPAILVWIDYNQNGQRDSAPPDRQIAYSYRGDPDYQMRYYSDYSGNPAAYEIISQRISGFSRSLTDDYVFVDITGCWDPAESSSLCGSAENPSVKLLTRIKMPAVSTN